jgi:platelet-activating factor acetylhydrolase IB subunit alpha
MTVKIWSMDKFACQMTLQGHDHTVSGIQFIPNENLLLSCSWDCDIKLWETNTGFCKKTFRGHEKWVWDIKINKKGDMFASCGRD